VTGTRSRHFHRTPKVHGPFALFRQWVIAETVAAQGCDCTQRRDAVAVILLVLLLALLLGGLGFAVHMLWIVAAIVLILWLVGFALGRGHAEGARGWYRW